MKRKIMSMTLVLAVMLVGIVPLAAAQQVAAQSDLEQLYSVPAASRCGAVPTTDLATVNFYPPKFKMAEQSYVKIETLDKASWMCMKTSLPQFKANQGYGWVPMSPRSQVGFTASNAAYYLGTTDGQYLRCHNHILAIFSFKEVEESYTMTGSARAEARAEATAKGVDGRDGKDGRDGIDGQPGERGPRGAKGSGLPMWAKVLIPAVGGVVLWKVLTLKNGRNGRDGINGRDGECKDCCAVVTCPPGATPVFDEHGHVVACGTKTIPGIPTIPGSPTAPRAPRTFPTQTWAGTSGGTAYSTGSRTSNGYVATPATKPAVKATTFQLKSNMEVMDN